MRSRYWSLMGSSAWDLFTGYDWSKGGIVDTVQIWRGGLSIGAVIGGLVVLVIVAGGDISTFSG